MTRTSHILTASAGLFAITILTSASTAQATHYRGGLMTWSVVGIEGPATQYPAVQTEILSMSLSGGPVDQVLTLPEVGQFNVDSFFDVFTELSIDGQTFTVDSFFDITYRVSPSSSQPGSWDTEMLSMDLTGQAPGGPPVIVRLAPGQPSLGQIRATDLPDGTFNVDSFFDIWTEVSLDGGGTFNPATNPMRVALNGSALPEPASLSLLMLGSLAATSRRSRQPGTHRTRSIS